MATKPELLDQDTTIDDNDIVIKTSSSSVSKTIKFSNLFSVVAGKIADAISAANSAIWTAIYNKIKTITLDSPNTMSKDPINSTCLNSSLANYPQLMNYNNAIPVKVGYIGDNVPVYKKIVCISADTTSYSGFHNVSYPFSANRILEITGMIYGLNWETPINNKWGIDDEWTCSCMWDRTSLTVNMGSSVQAYYGGFIVVTYY